MSGLLKSLVVAARSGTADPKSAGEETVDLSGVSGRPDQGDVTCEDANS